MPPRNAKLSYGYDQWIRRPDEKGRLDSLLKAFRTSSEQSGFNTDMIGVVCWRGLLMQAMVTRDGPWELNVMRLGNTLYLEEHLDDIKLRAKSSDAEHPRQRQNMYYGYSFESYCTADKSRAPSHPREPPGWGGVVDTNEQWCSVVKTKLGDTRIVLGGEVDCVEGGEPRIDKMIELKTSMRIRDERDRMRFESKLLKFYFQSFLLGIPRIVVGFRTPAGELTATESFSTLDLPRMVRGKPGGWDASVGLNWGDRILTWLKDRCRNRTDANDNSMDVWRLKFTPGSGVGLRLVSEEDRVDVESDAEVERIGFLPKWYLEGHAGMPVSRPSDLISAPSGWKI
ncbi:RAI1-domain-containing protein [Flagelloscypha sp. PMI_526]|nr:RAI1-domain-containing protein [Flagelloscypha sp. PMI_526]